MATVEGAIHAVYASKTKNGGDVYRVKILDSTLDDFVYVDSFDERFASLGQEIKGEKEKASKQSVAPNLPFISMTLNKLGSWAKNGNHGLNMRGSVKESSNE